MEQAAKLKTMDILGVPVCYLTMAEAAAYIEETVAAGRQCFAVTANAEIIMECQKDAFYRDLCCQEADLVLPDGAGAVWAGRHLGYPVPERVAGYDLLQTLLARSVETKAKIFFLGSAPGVAEAAAAAARQQYGPVEIVGCRDGYFSPAEEGEVVAAINASGATYLFAALGAPKQELWLKKWRLHLNCRLLMGVGGSFDVMAGRMERAPKWMQEASLEWLFRLYKQPSRWLRMLALPHFALLVLWKGRKNK